MPDDLLPPNATTQERAVSLALDRLPEVPIRQLWSPQTCPAAQLPWLAWALSVDEWDSTWPEETKRQVIASSIDQHRKKGTVGALRRALQRLGYEVEIDERTGVAYTFRLRFKVREGEATAGAVLDQAVTKATAIALRQKNARSELLDIALLGEGGTAGLYAGGAPISGAEVEIKDPNASIIAKPLDDHELGLIGSFWTTRMHSRYSGPIGRVKRASDNAELNYFTVAELKAFVDGTTWNFVRLYSQKGPGVMIAYTTKPVGEFDSNGVPWMRKAAVPDMGMDVYFGKRTVQAVTLMLACNRPTNNLAGIQLGSYGINPERFYTLVSGWFGSTSEMINNGASVGTPASYSHAGVGKSCLVSRFNATDTIIEGSDGSGTGTPGFTTARINTASMGATVENHVYGCSFWARDIGADASTDLITKVETELQF